MDQTHSQKTGIIKMLAYLALLIVSFYVIANLNIFPGAVSYEETSEGVEITHGALEKTTVTLDTEEYETSDWLRLRLLQADIRMLQGFLTMISVLIPISLFFILEHKRFDMLKLSKTLKILSIVLVFFVLFVFLTIGYAETVESIEEQLSPLLVEKEERTT